MMPLHEIIEKDHKSCRFSSIVRWIQFRFDAYSNEDEIETQNVSLIMRQIDSTMEESRWNHINAIEMETFYDASI